MAKKESVKPVKEEKKKAQPAPKTKAIKKEKAAPVEEKKQPIPQKYQP